MPNPYEKVNPGEPFRCPAVFYNALVDLVLARLRGGPASDAPRDGTLIRILNNTGGPLDELSVVAVGNPDLTVDATTQESFLSDPVMQGNTPAAADAGRFAVLLAHAEAGGVAAAAIDGLAVLKVDAGDGSDFADVAAGVTDSLVATATGSARILWRQAGTGKQWAAVRLGGGGAGPSVKFGVLTSTWATGDNAVSLTPCKGPTDATATGADAVAAYIQFPVNKPAPSFDGQPGDILAYMTSGGISFLVGAPVLPAGTQKFQVLVNTAGPGASNWRPDFVRARGA